MSEDNLTLEDFKADAGEGVAKLATLFGVSADTALLAWLLIGIQNTLIEQNEAMAETSKDIDELNTLMLKRLKEPDDGEDWRRP